ncbi:MAG: type I-C CRISPR-associated protein Cas7/Csd2 [Spirochaetota bacterium]
MSKIDKRYDFVIFFDVKDGNPNGDPDAGNLPRIDAETGMGLVTDVCLKRKVRNFIQITNGKQEGYDIFVKERGILNDLIEKAYVDIKIDLEIEPKNEKDGKKRLEKGKAQGSEIDSGRNKMCKDYFDIRAFGAVLSTGANAGQVRGPIQLTFARSLEPVVALEHSITRMAVTRREDFEKGKDREMGRKFTVPYGLYRAHGFVSAHLAEQTKFDSNDLELFWKALQDMFDHDHSAARGLMSTRQIVVFEHDTALGNKPAHELFERVTWKRTTEGPARDYSDYEIMFDGEKIKNRFEKVKVS